MQAARVQLHTAGHELYGTHLIYFHLCQIDATNYNFVAMTYDLSNPYHLTQFQARAKKLTERGAKVELTEKTTMSRNQNRYLHAIIGVVAMETGNSLEYTKREYFKRLVNRSLFVTCKEDPVIGAVVEDVRSITAITQEDLSRAIDKFKLWSQQELGIILPNPDDDEILKMIEIEMGRSKYI